MITWKRCKKCNKTIIGVADNMKQDIYCGDLMMGHCRKNAEYAADVFEFFGMKK